MDWCFLSEAEKPYFFSDSIHQVILMHLYNLLVTKRKKEAQVVGSLLDSGRGQASVLRRQYQRFTLVTAF